MSAARGAVAALVSGAVLIGLAPIFVRLADVGPVAAAFWRLALALPLLALLMLRAPAPSAAPPTRFPVWLWLAGAFFAADLAVWHQSIRWTSVANATLLANLAPVFVTLAAWWLFGERVRRAFVAGIAVTLAGALVLLADSLRISSQTVLGDLCGVAASVFYSGYLLGVSRQRRHYSTVAVMFWTTATAAIVVLPLALWLPQPFWPQSGQGWLILAGLALFSHVGGQGAIAYALAHLPASFSAVSLLVQPVAAALFAWWLLSEPFGAQQALGGAIVLGGIWWCRRASAKPI